MATDPSPPRRGWLRRQLVRLADLVPPLHHHRQRDQALLADLRATTADLTRRTAERDTLAASLAARSAEPGVGIAVGSYVPIRPGDELTEEQREVVDRFHDLYYRRWQTGRGTLDVSWFGWHAVKCPLDLWVYQELIARDRPAVIVETGTYDGGSAMFLASMLDVVGAGEVVSVDIRERRGRPSHPRIRYLTGSSVDAAIVDHVHGIVDGRPCLVILDSDHSRDHVLAELRAYASLVPVGSYVIVEDSNVNGHPTWPEFGPGPMEAIDAFIAEDPRFVPDADMERFLLTMNPRGYLRRVA